MLRSTRARAAAIAVGVATAATTAVGLVALPAAAATGCAVTYTTNDWTSNPGQGGFTANLTVQNLGDPVSGWTLRFAFPNGQTVTLPGWSAIWSQSGANVTATSMSWNANLATGATASIGFNGTWSGSNPKPTSFSLNNVACTGSTTTTATTTTSPVNQPPAVTMTSPSDEVLYPAPADLVLAATATDPDPGDSVVRVEFYSGSALVASDTTAPFSAAMNDVPAGSYSFTAKAFDTHGASTTSTPRLVGVANTTNQPPRLSNLRPAPGSTFTAPANITVSVDATDPDGVVARVDFSLGSMSGSDTTAPFSYTFTDVPAGTYAMSLRAFDNQGGVAVLDPVIITVTDATSGAAVRADHGLGAMIGGYLWR